MGSDEGQRFNLDYNRRPKHRKIKEFSNAKNTINAPHTQTKKGGNYPGSKQPTLREASYIPFS